MRIVRPSILLSSLIAASALPLCGVHGYAQTAVLSRQVPVQVLNGRAQRVQTMNAAQTLELVLNLPLRNQAGLQGLLADLYNPKSNQFHQWLTPAQFDAAFGPATEDFAAVREWARGQNLTIVDQSPNHRTLTVRGTVKQINRAFGIEETEYHDTVLNRDFRAPDREPSPSLPVALLSVSGLDTSNPRTYHHGKDPDAAIPKSVKAKPSPSITGSGPSNTYLPSDIRAAYYGGGPLTGTGQTVAIFSYDGYIASDLTLWHTKTSTTSTVPVTNILTGGFDGGCELNNPCDDAEQILDIVQVQGMAPGLTGILFYEGLSAVTELNQMVMDDKAAVITSSWGGGDFGPGTTPYFQQMAAQGQTYLNATGDNGAFNSFTYLPPSSDPNIVQVGGTDLTTTGAAGPWASETAWVDSGGGFFDPGITIPAWQQLPGVISSRNGGSTTLRNSPDIAAEANFDNSTVVNGTFSTGYGGTSYATPRMAGYLALANQQSVANGYGTVGFINPQLYTLGTSSASAGIYHDITSGSAPSAAGNPTINASAVAGYDLVTGWGSPNGAGLINGLIGPTFSLAEDNTALTVQRGTSVTLNLTIQPLNGFTAVPTVTTSALPTGVKATVSSTSATSIQVLFSADNTAVLSTSTITISATSGSIVHTVPLVLTTGKRSNDDFTLSATNASTLQMGSGGSTVTVTPGSGLSGPVSLMVSNLPSGVTAAFNNASTSSTASLTFTASIATAPGTYAVIVTGTAGGTSFSHSTTLTLTIGAVASALADGGFEGSSSPWTFNSTILGASGYLCSRVCGNYPHSGNNYAYLNGFGSTDTDTLSQSFTVSGGTTKATLNFWLWINTAETSTTAKNDNLTVSIVNSAGTSTTVASFSNLNHTAAYTLYSYDLTPYLGQTVTLKFTGVENNSRSTEFLLDDISVVVQ